MKRRILGLFIAICMVMPFIGQLSTEKVFAAEIVDSGTCGKNVTWMLDSDGVLTISGNGAMDDYSWIYSSPFYNNDNIKSANIENDITSIGDFTFYGCSSLTSITIPDSVMSIGGSAFSGCSSLTSITIPDSVTSIKGSVFSGCSSLTGITIPDSVTSIEGGAFTRCDSLTSITIPDSVTRIGEGVFSGCNSLTSITVSDGNTVFDIRDNCNAIIDMATNTLIAGCCNTYIPDSVTSIGDNAFRDCSNLTSIVIPDSVTSIGNYAFAGCSGLTSITIPDGVISIGISAFSNCSNLTSIVIPNSVTSIGDHAFSWCSNLTSVTIPDSITSIEPGILYCCYSLTSITLPDSVTSIGNSAFCNCSSLTSITLPISVVSILESAFAVCSNLTDVYYFGDEADKDKISIEDGNETLQSAKWHYMKEADEEKQDEILKYYHEVLVNNDNQGDFNIIYLSNDNIPDLIYRSSDKTNISVYINGNEKASTGYYNSALNIEYYPKTGFFEQYNDGSELYPEYYVVDNIENEFFLFRTLSVVSSGYYYSYPWDGDSGSYKNVYYDKWIKSEEITEQAFDEKIAEFSKGKEKIKCEWFDNNIIGRSVFFPDEFEILNAENECEILYEGQKVYFRFIPDETSEYVIESSGDDDTYITLYCADNMNSILADDDDSGDGNNFKLIYTLEAGKEYYYVPRFFSNGAGTINFSFKEYSSEQVNIIFDGNGLILGYDVESATSSIQRQYEFGETINDPKYYYGFEDKNGLTIARWIREWSTDKNGENIVNFDSLTAQEDMILYAVRGKSFSVNFDYNVFSKDGKGTDVFDVLKGKSLNDAYPDAPRFLIGYYREDNSYYTPAVMSIDKNRIFIGWSTDKEGSNIVDMNYVPEDDTILYAIGDSAELDSGTSIPLTACINIAGLDTSEISLKWESSNPDVASLTDNGSKSQLLTAKQSGKTTITATYTDIEGKTASATCEIVVEGDVTLGDVNGSGDVTADDLTALARHVAKIETITDTSLLKAADVTSDGDVTADDLTKLARFVAKIITTLE